MSFTSNILKKKKILIFSNTILYINIIFDGLIKVLNWLGLNLYIRYFINGFGHVKMVLICFVQNGPFNFGISKNKKKSEVDQGQGKKNHCKNKPFSNSNTP